MKSDFVMWEDDFLAARAFAAGVDSGGDWFLTDSSAAGTPVVELVTPSESGEVKMAFDVTAEVQNLCLSWNNKLSLDIDRLIRVLFRVKLGQAGFDATSSLAFGLASARNDAIATIATRAMFKLNGSTAIVVDTDDGTTEKLNQATGKTLVNVYQWFEINFSTGKGDVRFFAGGQPVVQHVKFDMSAESGGLQPYIQLQKTANANVNAVHVDHVLIESRRPL